MFTYIILALYMSIIYSISSEVTFLSRKLNTTRSSIYFNISDQKQKKDWMKGMGRDEKKDVRVPPMNVYSRLGSSGSSGSELAICTTRVRTNACISHELVNLSYHSSVASSSTYLLVLFPCLLPLSFHQSYYPSISYPCLRVQPHALQVCFKLRVHGSWRSLLKEKLINMQ